MQTFVIRGRVGLIPRPRARAHARLARRAVQNARACSSDAPMGFSDTPLIHCVPLVPVRALLLLLLTLQLPAGAWASVRTPGVNYRSIVGDPGMKWKGFSATAENLRHSAARASLAAGHPTAQPVAPAAQVVSRHPSTQGPRMQLYFYGLCSKAGYSNVSVLPAASDICETKSGVEIGLGVVSMVNATDCCAACLAEPWCLAWTRKDEHTCLLKDNALTVPHGSGGSLPTLGHQYRLSQRRLML